MTLYINSLSQIKNQFLMILAQRVLVNHDELLSIIQLIIINEADLQRRTAQLKQKYLLSENLPYPWIYYHDLISKLSEIIEVASFENQYIKENWQFLVKLTLYMSSKRISIKKYGFAVANNQNIKQQLKNYSINDFGPVGCKIINFFFFLSIGKVVRHLQKLLIQKLQLLDQHFKQIGSNNNIGKDDFIDILQLDQDIKIRNYLLSTYPQQSQWSTFVSNFAKKGNVDHFCRIIIITQPKQSFLIVNQNTYPFSIETISNAYLQIYNTVKHERLLTDKIVQVRKITQKCRELMNINIFNSSNVIQINFHTQKQNPLIEIAIEIILNSQSTEDKVYYLLLARIEKLKKNQARWNLHQDHISQIFAKLYFNTRSISMENL